MCAASEQGAYTPTDGGTSSTRRCTRPSPAERREYNRSDPARCWRVREFDGDDDKLLAEYQQDIESGQPREGRQEFKGCVAELVRVCLHAEREC